HSRRPVSSLAPASAPQARAPESPPIPPSAEPLAVPPAQEPPIAHRRPKPASRALATKNEDPPGRAEARASASPQTNAVGSCPIAEELELIGQARAQLERGSAAQALERLDEHRTRCARGSFREESQALHILALCRAQRIESARAEAAAFRMEFPHSP